jgi:hypothetical protein
MSEADQVLTRSEYEQLATDIADAIQAHGKHAEQSWTFGEARPCVLYRIRYKDLDGKVRVDWVCDVVDVRIKHWLGAAEIARITIEHHEKNGAELLTTREVELENASQ